MVLIRIGGAVKTVIYVDLNLLSTNAIENVIRNWREHTSNIKCWTVKADMIERWSASGLLWASAGSVLEWGQSLKLEFFGLSHSALAWNFLFTARQSRIEFPGKGGSANPATSFHAPQWSGANC